MQSTLKFKGASTFTSPSSGGFFRRLSRKAGMTQHTLAWHLCQDDTHKMGRGAPPFLSPPPPLPANCPGPRSGARCEVPARDESRMQHRWPDVRSQPLAAPLARCSVCPFAAWLARTPASSLKSRCTTAVVNCGRARPRPPRRSPTTSSSIAPTDGTTRCSW